MADCYAHDNPLEPALAVVCEFLKSYVEIGSVWKWAATFMGMTQSYQKLGCVRDHCVENCRTDRKNICYHAILEYVAI